MKTNEHLESVWTSKQYQYIMKAVLEFSNDRGEEFSKDRGEENKQDASITTLFSPGTQYPSPPQMMSIFKKFNTLWYYTIK